jgi:hypothetical protein
MNLLLSLKSHIRCIWLRQTHMHVSAGALLLLVTDWLCVCCSCGWLADWLAGVLDGGAQHMHAAIQQQLLEQKTISLIAQPPFIGSSKLVEACMSMSNECVIIISEA